MSSHLRLITQDPVAPLQPGQATTVSAAEQQGHKLLDQISPSFGEIALKREDLKLVLKDTPDDGPAIVAQIRNLQDFYRDGWQLCQQTLNKMGRG
ncbi:hypothetical protein PsW64_02347 [Pseudovibrio sp. W64]|uniref:hypothetical protein n=1 Tax=Pseudovibrio sp. W64 TaxID=1735583 RepID=UPI0007AEA5A7|nr:hypothetical protein [Pseudovibrio sp. W64]KZK81759.1 hypothetical protein PsW64_02347 [Pseudovibrio sp. W64]